jgi:hypothetical protein
MGVAPVGRDGAAFKFAQFVADGQYYQRTAASIGDGIAHHHPARRALNDSREN